jgi:hypothetical protein
MYVTRTSLPRRTVLRGLGAVLALPFLDAMTPAFARARAQAAHPLRFGAVYLPNGAPMKDWMPKAAGALEITPLLEPLAAY